MKPFALRPRAIAARNDLPQRTRHARWEAMGGRNTRPDMSRQVCTEQHAAETWRATDDLVPHGPRALDPAVFYSPDPFLCPTSLGV